MSEADEREPELGFCPAELTPAFAAAEQIMTDFFAGLERRPERGELQISGVRYLLMRTESLATELHEELRKTFGEAGARQIRYKIARACGRRDARMFFDRLGVDEPAMKIALGPVHFAHVGWASVNIHPESSPQPDEGCLIVYDHPFSFEAAAYVDNGRRAKLPVCLMNAGYSAGWSEISFGVELEAEELSCRARGDDKCQFVMAHPKHLQRRIAQHRARTGLA